MDSTCALIGEDGYSLQLVWLSFRKNKPTWSSVPRPLSMKPCRSLKSVLQTYHPWAFKLDKSRLVQQIEDLLPLPQGQRRRRLRDKKSRSH